MNAVPSPEKMRESAAMMRKDPATVRKLNPQFANYDNDQLRELGKRDVIH